MINRWRRLTAARLTGEGDGGGGEGVGEGGGWLGEEGGEGGTGSGRKPTAVEPVVAALDMAAARSVARRRR